MLSTGGEGVTYWLTVQEYDDDDDDDDDVQWFNVHLKAD